MTPHPLSGQLRNHNSHSFPWGDSNFLDYVHLHGSSVFLYITRLTTFLTEYSTPPHLPWDISTRVGPVVDQGDSVGEEMGWGVRNGRPLLDVKKLSRSMMGRI